jgi:choline monooxygenase
VYEKAVLHECNYNWKTFIEVYLEDYHVGPFHPGLGSSSPVTTCAGSSAAAPFGADGGRAQRAAQGRLAGLPALARRGAASSAAASRPQHGAIWLTYYPTVMVEWYPHVLVVSTLFPRGPRKTLNLVEFFYPEEIAAFERDFIEAEQAAYMETCIEDDEIAERMDAGRLALMERGDDEVGPYQSPMEDGMQHFHEWYRPHRR